MSMSMPEWNLEAALFAGTREHYEDADLYDHEYRRRRADLTWYRALAKTMLTDEGHHTGPILELGCGSGRLLVPLLRDGHTVWGIDRATPMLQRCRQRVNLLNARARARVHILQGDFRELPLAASFPLILCPFNGLQHLYTRQDVERCFAEVRRLLAPGGLFAFDITHPDPAWLARDPTRRYDRRRFRHPATGERLIYSTSHAYDPATQIDWIRLYYDPDPSAPSRDSPTGNEKKMAPSTVPRKAPNSAPQMVTLAHRLFFPAEIEALLYYAGFEILHHAGSFPDVLSTDPMRDLDGAPLTIVSEEQVICARVR